MVIIIGNGIFPLTIIEQIRIFSLHEATSLEVLEFVKLAVNVCLNTIGYSEVVLLSPTPTVI